MMLDRILLWVTEKKQGNFDFDQTLFAILAWDHVGNQVNLFGVYEKREIECLKRLVFPTKEKRICLDIGANIGNHTRIFSRFFGKVHSFEPNTDITPLLKYNTRTMPNVIVHEVGASSRASEMQATYEPGNIGSLHLSEAHGSENKLIGQLTTVMLDDYLVLEEGDFVDFIKIDIEGHELDAIVGMQKLISQHKPHIAFECNSELDGRRVQEKLSELGYQNYYEMVSENFLERFSLLSRVVYRAARQVLSKDYEPKLNLKKLNHSSVPKGALIIASTENLL